jgi:hypothetical protein
MKPDGNVAISIAQRLNHALCAGHCGEWVIDTPRSAIQSPGCDMQLMLEGIDNVGGLDIEALGFTGEIWRGGIVGSHWRLAFSGVLFFLDIDTGGRQKKGD